MGLSYYPLWRMLKNLDVSKMEFARRVDLSNATLAKLGKNEPVALSVIERICKEFSCDVGNVIRYHPEEEHDVILLKDLSIGTIVLCPCYPIGSPIGKNVFSAPFPRNLILLKKFPCVILRQYIWREPSETENNFLVAPLSFDELPDTIFDVKFENVMIDHESKSGYIHLSKIGYVIQKNIEALCGHMPDSYLSESQLLLDKIETIFEIRK